MVLVATDEEIEELKHELLETGLAIDVRSYTINRTEHSDHDSEALQPGNTDGNGIVILLKIILTF